MTKRKIKAKVGDIFAIPIAEDLYCFGQIIADVKPNPKLYILFDFILNKIPDIDLVCNVPILAIAHMQDFAINDKEWIIIGNAEVAINNLIFPNYKIYKGDQMVVVDYMGRFIREATHRDKEELNYRTTFSSFDFESLARYKFIEKKSIGTLDGEIRELLYDSCKWTSSCTYGIDNMSSIPVLDEVPLENNEKFMVTVMYKLGNSDLDVSKNLSKRYYIEELLDTRLQKMGLGDCDGGEIGHDMIMIYCFVTEPEKAVNIIKEELKKAHLLDGAVITYR